MKSNLLDFTIELLKSNNILGLVVSGDNVRSQCPFHRTNETKLTSRTLSISCVGETALYRCFSCGETGNIIQLIAFLYKCSYDQAQRKLFKRVALTPITIENLQNSLYSNVKDHTSLELFNEIDLPAKFSPKKMIKYLEFRNRTIQHNVMDIHYIINLYNLYYCDSGRYSGRIIMPIRDIHGRNVFFTNRDVDHHSEKKNMFPAGMESSNFVYGLYESIGRKKVMICEGPFEVYQLKSYAKLRKLNEWGFVAIMGTEMSEQRAALISSVFEESYICLDNEPEVWKREQDKKTGMWKKNKIEKITDMLSDFMPTFNITDLLYPGKEPANSTKSQLKKLFNYIPKKTFLDKLSGYF